MGENLIVIDLPLVFLLAMPVNLVPTGLRMLASLGGMLVAAVMVLLVTLLPLTGLWPEAPGGRWALQLAAWASLGPAIAAAGMLAIHIVRERTSTVSNREVSN